MTSKHLREIISSVPLPHPAQIPRPSARTASVARGTKAAPVGVPTCHDYSVAAASFSMDQRAASIKFQLSGDHVQRGPRPSAPTISCNQREPGINSASAACPTSPERARALRSRRLALLRATRHFINGQTARMFLRTDCWRVFRSPSVRRRACSRVLLGIIAANKVRDDENALYRGGHGPE